MTANHRKSYFGYLNKLVDEYNNTFHRSIGKKATYADYSALPEEFESNHKAPKFKVSVKVSITIYKNIFSKGYSGKWSKEISGIDSALKTSP